MLSSALFIAAAAGLVAASPAPAPQQLDFAALAAAPVVPSGPSGVAVNQTVTASTDVTVTAVATALAKRGAPNSNKIVADAIAVWDCLMFQQCSTSAVCTTTSSKTSSSTYTFYTSMSSTAAGTHGSSSSTTSPAVTSSSAASTSASASAPASAAASTTLQSSATTASSSSTACPTQPEAGTYCGFINPEDPCAPQPGGYGPSVTPDTVAAFQTYSLFQSQANAAPSQIASSADGQVYQQVFKDLNASVSSSSYIGLYSLYSYNVSECAAYCDNTALCTAFNMYVERDPSQAPSANDSTAPTVWGYWCPNPASMTSYKCTLYGSSIDSSLATNFGQYREQFQIVITGSDGYDKTNSTVPICSISTGASTPTATVAVSSTSSAAATTSAKSTFASASSVKSSSTSPAKSSSTSSAVATPVSVPKWKAGSNCGTKAVSCQQHWMGTKVFPGAYNPQICADYAWAQTGANKAYAVLSGQHSFSACKYFNAAYYHKNGKPWGTYCTLYDTALDSSYNTLTGGASGSDNYSCKQSWTFELDVDSSFATC